MDQHPALNGTTSRTVRTAGRVLPALAVSVAAVSWAPPPASAGTVGRVPPPATFVATAGQAVTPSRLAVYDTATGRRLRFLTPPRPGGGLSQPVLDDAGTTVVYAAGGGACASDVLAVPADGSAPPRLLVRGTSGPVLSPALSHRDDRLAYVQEHCDGTAPALVVRTVPATGPGTVRYQATGGEAVTAPRWSRHGVLVFLTQDGPGPGPHTLSSLPGSPVLTSAAPAGCTWTSAAWFATGSRDLLLASLQCGDAGSWRVLDPQLRTVRELTSPQGQRGAQTVSVDASGTWAVYQENGASVPGAVWRWRFGSGAAPRPIAQGPFEPTWR